MVDVAARQVFPNYSDSDSGDEWVGEAPEEPSVPPPGSLVSQRPRIADYVTDISYQVETEDREDHSFFGIMFDLEAKNDLPIEHVLLTEIMVRGDLGHVTVWWTPGSFHPELKGSIGEGPNHSNHLNHSNSFKIGIFRKFSLENSKFQKISTFSKLSAKFRQNFIKI